jgi:hypothetical protein
MHTAINSHPFLGKSSELKELRLTEKQLRLEQKQMHLKKKNNEENYHLHMMQMHGCEKQKKFVTDKLAQEKRLRELLAERNSYEQAFCSARKKMDERKKERYLASLYKTEEKRQEKIRKTQEYRAEKKELKMVHKETAGEKVKLITPEPMKSEESVVYQIAQKAKDPSTMKQKIRTIVQQRGNSKCRLQ